MANKYLINGMWAEVTLMCGNHATPTNMVIQQGPHSLFYACPKYFEENRTADEFKCANRLNLIEFEKMIDHINERLCTEAAMCNCINLTNHAWMAKGVEFKILVHYPNKIIVMCINHPALTDIQR